MRVLWNYKRCSFSYALYPDIVVFAQEVSCEFEVLRRKNKSKQLISERHSCNYRFATV